jgi:hypothetical protein
MKSGKGLTLPKPPIQIEERKRLNILTELIKTFSKGDKISANEWIKVVNSNHSERENAVIFYDVANAASFYNTFKRIVSGSDLIIGLSLAPLAKSGSINIDTQIKVWTDALNIDSSDVRIETGISRQPDHDMCGRLSIYLDSPQDTQTQGKQSVQQSNTPKKIWRKTRSSALVGAAYLGRIGLCNPI